jgi:hypothetical protein
MPSGFLLSLSWTREHGIKTGSIDAVLMLFGQMASLIHFVDTTPKGSADHLKTIRWSITPADLILLNSVNI